MTDEKIVDLYWQRDESAITETAQKYNRYLEKIAHNILPDLEDCAESVNDTYLAAWNSMPENRPSLLGLYLGKITRQISIDIFRKKTSKKRFASQYTLSLEELSECMPGGEEPENEADLHGLQESINRFLHTLPVRDRNLFIGRYYFLDSTDEVAKYCGVSPSNAKTILHRVRKALKTHLQKEGFLG